MKRTVRTIIVHCSATPAGRDVTVADIDRWHRARGFRSIGYHYVVLLDGTVCPGRPEDAVGAHCLGQNATSIGVCYVGGLDADGSTPRDTRTPAQRRALLDLLADLLRRYPGAVVRGHRDFAPKACPSFDATAAYRHLLAPLVALVAVLAMSLTSCRSASDAASFSSVGSHAVTALDAAFAADGSIRDSLVLNIRLPAMTIVRPDSTRISIADASITADRRRVSALLLRDTVVIRDSVVTASVARADAHRSQSVATLPTSAVAPLLVVAAVVLVLLILIAIKRFTR